MFSRVPRSFVFFILVLSFGILFVGCSSVEPDKSFEEFSFTDNDLQRVQQALSSSMNTETGTGASSSAMTLDLTSSEGTAGSVAMQVLTIDPEKVKRYERLRTSLSDKDLNLYRVDNPYLNVRSQMSVGSAQVARLDQGEMVTVIDLPSGEWAKVRLANGKEGYVAFKYLAKVTTEQRLEQDKKAFQGKYEVDFSFLNIRKDPSSQGEKIGELPGHAIVKPININKDWARVSFDGKEGFVSAQYLKPFQPVFQVRQEEYTLPILQYRASDPNIMANFGKHMAALMGVGKKVMTLKAFYDLVLTQETKDVRWRTDAVVLMITDVGGKNVQAVNDALQSSGVSATLFIPTKELGIAAITEKVMLNLLANGDDLQSQGHTSDDLRSLTDSQIELELKQSKMLIEQITNREVYAVVYPFGGVNDRVMQKAAAIGYLFGISQTPDKRFVRGQFLRLPSLFITPTMSGDELLRLVQ